MPNEKAVWRVVLESYPCTTCNAKAGNPCTTKTGWKLGMPHQARVNAAARCQVCGIRIQAESVVAGDHLCPKCQLVRDLEVERATKHRRGD